MGGECRAIYRPVIECVRDDGHDGAHRSFIGTEWPQAAVVDSAALANVDPTNETSPGRSAASVAHNPLSDAISADVTTADGGLVTHPGDTATTDSEHRRRSDGFPWPDYCDECSEDWPCKPGLRAELEQVRAERDQAVALIKAIAESAKDLTDLVYDSDVTRLAIGEICQPGQPAACGDFHNAGQCVQKAVRNG